MAQKIPVLPLDLQQYAQDAEQLAADLIELLGDDTDFALGLRGFYAPEMGKSACIRSWQSPDGQKSYRLAGTSTIGLTADWTYQGDLDGDACGRVARYGDQEYVSVICGKYDRAVNEHANDAGETILIDAKVVAYIRRAGAVAAQ